MDTDDGLNANLPKSEVESNSGTAIIRAEGLFWAELEVEYSWSGDGTSFSVTARRYRASANGNSKGSVRLGLTSKNFVDYKEITDRANQDGKWHNLSYPLMVAGNVKVAHVHFLFIYGGGVNVKLWGDASFLFRPPVPVITSPPVSSSSVIMTGTGGVVFTDSVIDILDSVNFSTLANARVELNGNWTAEFAAPSGARTIKCFALQMIGLSGKRSPDVTITVTDITLTRPASEEVVRADQLVFEGTGFLGVKVWAVRPDSGVELSRPTTVGSDNKWRAAPTNTLASGRWTAQAAYQLNNGPIKYTEERRAFIVLGELIFGTLEPYQEMNFTLTGGGGFKGAFVEIRIDFGGPKVGEGTVEDLSGVFTIPVQMPEAGPTSLVAVQTYLNVSSKTSAPRSYKIKPPKLVGIQVSYPSLGTIRFSGAGYDAATVEVYIKNNMTPQVCTVVSSGRWSVDWPDQVPGPYVFNLRQKVADGQGGWIHSAWSDNVSATIPVPVPTLTARSGTDRKPELSGTGHSWSGQPATKVEVNVSGPSTPSIPQVNVNGSNWSYTATVAWAPGAYQLKVRQIFKYIRSEWTSPITLTIPTPLPTVSIKDNGLTPEFSGTCLEDAQVKLGFDGDQGTPHAATVTGATWKFTRPTPFTPGTYTARVIQTVNNLPSSVLSRTFTVVVLKPVITAPIDEDVDHNPIIRGTAGIAGAVMRVFDYVSDLQLGEDTPVAGNEWSVPLKDLSFGSNSVYVVQAYGSFSSEKSERVSFRVILFPPVIDHPQPGDDKARSFLIDGYARKVSGLDTARVELWLEGQDTPLASVGARGVDGYWSYQAQLPVGEYVLRAKQFFAGEPSDFSPDHDFTAVPAIPLIESPTLQQHVGATVTISGFGYVGDWVEVAWRDTTDTLLGRARVQANRTWSLQLQTDRPAGEQHWVVQQECEGYRSGWSDAHPVRLLSQAPTFTAPEVGHWFAAAPLFEGTGGTGKTIELSYWFDARQLIAQDCPVTGGQWSASPAASLKAGPYWVKARQVGADDSDWSDGPRIEVAGPRDVPDVGR
ncbi:hypothetical protein [Pseudomonas brassicacearum]|uniref:hypothetical protein n=1 Tax=Pseudomonas brassicacearum TaxID=930166 RepID=UPI001DDE2DAC|nr:hypothetical protein [Pseudomonas brassicacearum]CAH0255122.1 hypothetical protein SRABI06_03243 [Pseudomonas brassicacearum]